jgi:surfeit locus 1 family protein
MQYTFRPSLLATIIALLAVGVFSALSLWQVERAYYKQAIQDEIDALSAAPPLTLDVATPAGDIRRYRTVKAAGRYEANDYILLDNSLYRGKPGFQVVVPMHIDGMQQRLLVYLGWVAQGRTRAELPAIEIPAGQVSISGKLDLPSGKPVIVTGDVPNPEHERLWMYVDADKFSQQAGYPLLPLALYQSPAEDGQYLRDWPEFEAKTGMHVGYAIHWAVFALAALGIYLWKGMQGKTRHE